MKSKLKLFVWTDFNPDWTSGLAFAIAKDEKEARKMIIKLYSQGNHEPYNWGTLTIHPLTKKICDYVSGGG